MTRSTVNEYPNRPDRIAMVGRVDDGRYAAFRERANERICPYIFRLGGYVRRRNAPLVIYKLHSRIVAQENIGMLVLSGQRR